MRMRVERRRRRSADWRRATTPAERHCVAAAAAAAEGNIRSERVYGKYMCGKNALRMQGHSLFLLKIDPTTKGFCLVKKTSDYCTKWCCGLLFLFRI